MLRGLNAQGNYMYTGNYLRHRVQIVTRDIVHWWQQEFRIGGTCDFVHRLQGTRRTDEEPQFELHRFLPSNSIFFKRPAATINPVWNKYLYANLMMPSCTKNSINNIYIQVFVHRTILELNNISLSIFVNQRQTNCEWTWTKT